MKFILSFLAVCALFAEVNVVQAASFDCSKARKTIEIIICNDYDLSMLDGEMGSAFFELRAGAVEEERRQWLQEQRLFLKSRLERCPIPMKSQITHYEMRQIVECLKPLYNARISHIQAQRDFKNKVAQQELSAQQQSHQPKEEGKTESLFKQAEEESTTSKKGEENGNQAASVKEGIAIADAKQVEQELKVASSTPFQETGESTSQQTVSKNNLQQESAETSAEFVARKQLLITLSITAIAAILVLVIFRKIFLGWNKQTKIAVTSISVIGLLFFISHIKEVYLRSEVESGNISVLPTYISSANIDFTRPEEARWLLLITGENLEAIEGKVVNGTDPIWSFLLGRYSEGRGLYENAVRYYTVSALYDYEPAKQRIDLLYDSKIKPSLNGVWKVGGGCEEKGGIYLVFLGNTRTLLSDTGKASSVQWSSTEDISIKQEGNKIKAYHYGKKLNIQEFRFLSPDFMLMKSNYDAMDEKLRDFTYKDSEFIFWDGVRYDGKLVSLCSNNQNTIARVMRAVGGLRGVVERYRDCASQFDKMRQSGRFRHSEIPNQKEVDLMCDYASVERAQNMSFSIRDLL